MGNCDQYDLETSRCDGRTDVTWKRQKVTNRIWLADEDEERYHITAAQRRLGDEEIVS